ncbi:MAG: hypothetical protein ABS75_10965 [Pelagibacterium sp. SCN 63-23]|nr:MAG: hypothetical protein ABS75_10965 [Pelagibacterium sp. SCN 63-23]
MMRKLSSMDLWRLSEELAVIDAAILITGNDPSQMGEVYDGNESSWQQRTDYDGFDAAFKALKGAILSNKLQAAVSFPVRTATPETSGLRAVLREGKRVFHMKGLSFFHHDALVYLQAEPDWSRTTVEVTDLKAWMKSRGIFPEFFFPEEAVEGFRDQKHSRYSPKLACAVAAWEAVETSKPNHSVKDTVKAWVKANATRFGMAEADGLPSATGVEEVAKVVNWETKGGANRTGGEVTEALPPATPLPIENFTEMQKPARRPSKNAPAFEQGGLDEDIPF